ncbi:O-Methyltransferase involved in polyketide biosynthesis [Enhygromyxa salina]|uniref:O-Methyltransferase involved in polyketide biosynthesis n=1 Tax=Enhygromyxa salina TaxID=215803 RepID=A0A0C2D1S4_9BACT|nr:class I SAM-dependent methyltransferase [Enhygromyxa salina]KIG14112.1 O-Methyltransferase involved in polyketide biosynthesis [Enhygromyxa salina]
MSASSTARGQDPDQGQEYDKIGPTAHVTAYAWYQLGLPYSHLFATREGAMMYWAFRAATEPAIRAFKIPSLLDYLEFRHRMLDTQLDAMAPDRIIELGAGLSHRGVTWALDRGVRYTEIDLPHMSAAKRGMLDKAPGRVRLALHNGTLELRSTNILAPSFADEFAELVAGAERPVVVSEGMLDYFELSDRETLLHNLAAGFRKAGVAGHYLTDLQRGDRERKAGTAAKVTRQAIKLATRGQAVAKPFRNLEHVDRVFALAGFDAGAELAPKLLAEREPRLRRLRSPTTIWLASVNARTDAPA